MDRYPFAHRKTKIVATVGPATRDKEVIRQLLKAGMDVARINTSHASQDDVKLTVANLREVSNEEQQMLGILVDLAGPKIRVGNIEGEGLQLNDGDLSCLGSSEDCQIQINSAIKFKSVDKDARVMLDDGRIELEVVEQSSPTSLKVKVIHGGLLKSKKGVNFPGIALDVPALTEKDEAMLRFCLNLEIDWFALSFVRSPKDRAVIDKIFAEQGRKLPVMAKIEKPEAVEALDAIIDAFEGIMVARGDLGVELDLQEVPLIQKRIIRLCNTASKPVVTATQLLDSMVNSPSPTRAEVNDIANAIFDGTDAVMLSNETAVGNYPIRAVETMDLVARTTETAPIGLGIRSREGYQKISISNAISHAAVNIGRECETKVIVTMTHSGITAQGVARFRPRVRIVALSPDMNTCRKLQLVWGVTPFIVEQKLSTDKMIALAEKLLVDEKFVEKGEYFVFTAGVPTGQAGTTNLLKVQRVGYY